MNEKAITEIVFVVVITLYVLWLKRRSDNQEERIKRLESELHTLTTIKG